MKESATSHTSTSSTREAFSLRPRSRSMFIMDPQCRIKTKRQEDSPLSVIRCINCCHLLMLSLAHFQILLLPLRESPKRLDRRLFAEPSRAICTSVDALADQAVDARHINMICIMSDRGWRWRYPDLFDLGDYLDRIWKRLAHIEGRGRGAVVCQSWHRTVFHPPNRRLSPVLNPDLAKDRLDVDLDGRLGDVVLSRYAFVGVAFDQAAKD